MQQSPSSENSKVPAVLPLNSVVLRSGFDFEVLLAVKLNIERVSEWLPPSSSSSSGMNRAALPKLCVIWQGGDCEVQAPGGRRQTLPPAVNWSTSITRRVGGRSEHHLPGEEPENEADVTLQTLSLYSTLKETNEAERCWRIAIAWSLLGLTGR